MRWLLLTSFLLWCGLGMSCDRTECKSASDCPASYTCQQGQCRCAVGLQLCQSRCVNPKLDPLNCGGCGVICQGGSCRDGICTTGPGCPADQQLCQGSCIDLQTSPQHCGACGQTCQTGQRCIAGSCVAASCEPPLTSCGGACVSTQSDARHCGACDNTCQTGQQCTQGACLCQTGLTLCAGSCVDLRSDARHCGACGNTCPSGQLCAQGTCQASCPPATPDVCLGGCVDLRADARHCGTCGNTCNAGQLCQDGVCVCPPTLTSCAGRCVDLQADREHCGACGSLCQPGTVCSAGACAASCPLATPSVCLGGCIDLQTHPLHCSNCGVPCPPGERCDAGTCTCAQGWDRCGGAQCLPLDRDAQHCGACNNTCGAGELCRGGRCVPNCQAPLTRCDVACVNLQNDTANCGACGNACQGQERCKDGTCLAPCPSGQQLCDGFCADTQQAHSHCGGCNQPCRVGQRCRQGRCQTSTLQIRALWSDLQIPQSIGRIGGMALDSQGVLYFSDSKNHRILRVEASGALSIFAGSGQAGFQDGRGEAASFRAPQGLAFDDQGNLYVADTSNDALRKIDLSGQVSTVIGNRGNGFVDGNASEARLKGPQDLLLGPGGVLFILDFGNKAFRTLDPQGKVSTFSTESGKDGNGDPVHKVDIYLNKNLAISPGGDIYLPHTPSQVIYRVSAQGQVELLAGQVSSFGGNQDGPARSARFSYPQGVALDAQGNLYIAEFGNKAIRKLDNQGNVTTFAGANAASSSLKRATWERLDHLLFDPIRGGFWVSGNETRQIYIIE